MCFAYKWTAMINMYTVTGYALCSTINVQQMTGYGCVFGFKVCINYYAQIYKCLYILSITICCKYYNFTRLFLQRITGKQYCRIQKLKTNNQKMKFIICRRINNATTVTTIILIFHHDIILQGCLTYTIIMYS